MTVQAWFEATNTEIAPGSTVVLPLSVTNLGTTTDSFSLAPTGMAAAWATVKPAHVTLFGGAATTVDVEVSAPRLPSTTAGSVALGVRVVPHSDPNDVEMSEITLQVAPIFERRITVLQPALRTRRRAVYELLVENLGNTQANCQMYLLEPTSRLDGRFDPPAVGVEPGGSSLVRLRVAATRLQWERRARSIPFRVEAVQTGAPSATAGATYVQAPLLPDRLFVRLGALLATAGLAALAWVGVVRPAIDDAADRAAAEREPTVVTVAPTPGDDGAPVVTVPEQPVVAPVVDEGTPFSTVLTSGAGSGQTSAQEFVVPEGQVLMLSDYLVQNPFGDSGVARLRIGQRELQWDLAVHLDGIDVANRFNTPLAVGAGEAIVFEVTCGVPGQEGAAGCSATALVGGRLLPAT